MTSSIDSRLQVKSLFVIDSNLSFQFYINNVTSLINTSPPPFPFSLHCSQQHLQLCDFTARLLQFFICYSLFGLEHKSLHKLQVTQKRGSAPHGGKTGRGVSQVEGGRRSESVNNGRHHSVPPLWNSQPSELRNTTLLTHFKSNLISSRLLSPEIELQSY